MLNGILCRVIDEQNNTRHVIQTDIVSAAPFDIAESNRNHRLNRKIIIGDSINMADKNIVVVNPPNGQPQIVVKPSWFA